MWKDFRTIDSISKSIFLTYDSVSLIMSHMLLVFTNPRQYPVLWFLRSKFSQSNYVEVKLHSHFNNWFVSRCFISNYIFFLVVTMNKNIHKNFGSDMLYKEIKHFFCVWGANISFVMPLLYIHALNECKWQTHMEMKVPSIHPYTFLLSSFSSH